MVSCPDLGTQSSTEPGYWATFTGTPIVPDPLEDWQKNILGLTGKLASSELNAAVKQMFLNDALVALGAAGAVIDSPVEGTGPYPPGWNENWQWMSRGGDKAGMRWFDESGGEWRLHETDPYHTVPHWDYNPNDAWNSAWKNIP